MLHPPQCQNGCFVVASVILIPCRYDAMAMELTTDYDERSSLFGYKGAFQVPARTLANPIARYVLEYPFVLCAPSSCAHR